jgi:hypothetical protein
VQKFHGGVEFEPHLHATSAVARRGASRLVAKAGCQRHGTKIAPAAAVRSTTAPLREVYEDSGSRSAAGVAAYPTRPPAPADSRTPCGDDAGGRLRSSEPWWLVRNGRGAASAAIAGDLDCDVAVIGAGMTGALIAHGLAEDGHEVVVLDRRDRALGSTAASTALLQYELDTMLTELSRLVGPVRARRAYQACVDAIGLLDALDERLGRCADFSRCESLYLSTQRRDRPRLLEEMRLRQESGIHVALLQRDDLIARGSCRPPSRR